MGPKVGLPIMTREPAQTDRNGQPKTTSKILASNETDIHVCIEMQTLLRGVVEYES